MDDDQQKTSINLALPSDIYLEFKQQVRSKGMTVKGAVIAAIKDWTAKSRRQQ